MISMSTIVAGIGIRPDGAFAGSLTFPALSSTRNMSVSSPQNHQATPPPPSQEYSRLLDAPIEILDQILAYLASPADLLSFACSSRLCASLVIPHHIEYRRIRTEASTPHVWAHLARRADRACSIREVELWEATAGGPGSRRAQRRVPWALLDQDEVSLAEKAPHVAYCGGRKQLPDALANMEALEAFRWDRNMLGPYCRLPGQVTSIKDQREEVKAVFRTLKGLENLKTLDLSGTFRLHPMEGEEVVEEEENQVHPLYEISHLETLRLSGPSWVTCLADQRFSKFLTTNPITTLDISFDVAYLALGSIILPHLKTLKVSFTMCPLHHLSPRTRFLESHPGIEDLTWSSDSSPDSPITTTQQTLLPNLRRMKTNHTFLTALFAKSESSPAWTKLEEVFIDQLNSAALQAFVRAKVTKLRKLVVGYVPDVSVMAKMGKTFGDSVEILGVKLDTTAKGPRMDQAAWMDWIGKFPNLHVLQLEAKDILSSFDLEGADPATKYSRTPRPLFEPQHDQHEHPLYSGLLAQNPGLRRIALDQAMVMGTSVVELGSRAGGMCGRRRRKRGDVYVSYVPTRRSLW